MDCVHADPDLREIGSDAIKSFLCLGTIQLQVWCVPEVLLGEYLNGPGEGRLACPGLRRVYTLSFDGEPASITRMSGQN